MAAGVEHVLEVNYNPTLSSKGADSGKRDFALEMNKFGHTLASTVKASCSLLTVDHLLKISLIHLEICFMTSQSRTR